MQIKVFIQTISLTNSGLSFSNWFPVVTKHYRSKFSCRVILAFQATTQSLIVVLYENTLLHFVAHISITLHVYRLSCQDFLQNLFALSQNLLGTSCPTTMANFPFKEIFISYVWVSIFSEVYYTFSTFSRSRLSLHWCLLR